MHEVQAEKELRKEQIKLEDGRYLIFYQFTEEEEKEEKQEKQEAEVK